MSNFGIRALYCLLSIASVNSAFAEELESNHFSELSMTKSVNKYFEENGHSPTNFVESCQSFEACETFNYHVKEYTFKGNASRAFKNLIAQTPKTLWTGSSLFDVGFDPVTNSFYGKSQDNMPSIHVGQSFFLELKIVPKMLIPVALKVIHIDEEKNILEMSYHKQNKSNGIQRLIFTQNGENFIIKHETRFKSNSKVRDGLMYRPFHVKLLDEFYESNKAILEQ